MMHVHSINAGRGTDRGAGDGAHDGGVYRACAPTKGRLLVATPPLDDPNFDRTVVLHGRAPRRGRARPGAQPPERASSWTCRSTHGSACRSAPSRVFSGGPVEPDALIALARTDGRGRGATTSEHLAPLSGDDRLGRPRRRSRRCGRPTISALRVFRGYAGWAAGQLEVEIESGSWLVLDSDPSDVFTADPDELWRTVLRRQPGRLGWLAEAPDDLGWN